MPLKPTLFVVTDIETTLRKRIAFDVAWQIIDRRGRVYGKGSYVIKEAFFHDVPYFSQKLGWYFDDTYAQLIKPASIVEVRAEYNRQVKELQDAGHRVILGAYNAAFDFKYLPESLNQLLNSVASPIPWMMHKVELIDIWQHWGESVPLHYRAATSESGKYVSTSAESAYRFEFMQPEFEERHIAWHDVLIESEILLKALARKKPMHVVKHPKDFIGAVWKRINTRLGIDGKTELIDSPHVLAV